MIPWHAPIPRRRFLRYLSGAAATGAGLSLALHKLPLLTPAQAADLTASPFPVDDNMAWTLLRAACGRGAGFSELYLENRVVTKIRLAESAIESVEEGISAGCGIRAVDIDRTGYAYADSFDQTPLLEAAHDAATIASSRPETWGGPSTFERKTPVAIVHCQRPPDSVGEDERIGWLRQIDQAARAYDPSVQIVTVDYQDEMLHYLVINSDGLWMEDSLPLIYARVNVIASKNGRRGTGMERISFRRGAEQMDADAPARAAREAARMAVAMSEAEEAPAGEMPVVLGSGGGVLFHEAVGHGLEGDAVRKGMSAFAGKVGDKVGSELVSVLDTGAIPDERGSYNMDDEGQAPQKSLLIEKGVLRGFLNDRITAGALGAPRTGNGRRQSYRFPPLVRMSNTYIDVGTDKVDEIVSQTKTGFFARNLGGGEVDTSTGNFTFGVLEGYLIEDGKIGRPVRGANLVGNGPEIMNRIDRVGPDQKFWPGTCGKGQWVPVGAGAPTLRISSMTVGGSR